MVTLEKCPFCGSSKILAGNVESPEGYGFKPNEVITGFVFTLRSPWAFHFGPAAHFCAKCCMVWSNADPKDAAKFLQKYATGALKARLEAIDSNMQEEP